MPYSLTWSIDPAVSNVLMFTTTTFWLLDMCLSFITGYNTSDGRVEMKHRRIARLAEHDVHVDLRLCEYYRRMGQLSPCGEASPFLTNFERGAIHSHCECV
eukprot:555119-Amphidinium_carterae.1